MEEEDDYNPDLAHWLQDSGRRRAIRLDESPEELLKYLEELTSKRLTSRGDILGYFKELEQDEANRQRAATKRRIVSETILVTLLALAVGHYYVWDVSLQIAALQKNHYFVPVSAPIARTAYLGPIVVPARC